MKKPRMGRPPLPESERGRRVNIYMPPDVIAALTKLAKAHGGNQSAAACAAILAALEAKKTRT